MKTERIVEIEEHHFITGRIPVKARYTERIPLGDPRPDNEGELIKEEEDVLIWRMRCDEDGGMVWTYGEGGYDFCPIWWKLEKGGGCGTENDWETEMTIEMAAKEMAAGIASRRFLDNIDYLDMNPVTLTKRDE